MQLKWVVGHIIPAIIGDFIIGRFISISLPPFLCIFSDISHHRSENSFGGILISRFLVLIILGNQFIGTAFANLRLPKICSRLSAKMTFCQKASEQLRMPFLISARMESALVLFINEVLLLLVNQTGGFLTVRIIERIFGSAS